MPTNGDCMVRLRKLEEKDVPFMLEWMHDEETREIFQANFADMSEKDVKAFIADSFCEKHKHFAIVDERDEYLGTISLKNIDMKNSNAEYAISTRKVMRGTSASKEATKLLLEYAFCELDLHRVYLCVLCSNIRARKFYEKVGFQYEGTFKEHLFQNGIYQDLLWYGITSEYYECNKEC